MVEGFTETKVIFKKTIAESPIVISHWTFNGTHTGEFMQIPPSNKKIAFDGVTVYRLIDSMIVEYWGYGDILGLKSQLITKGQEDSDILFYDQLQKRGESESCNECND